MKKAYKIIIKSAISLALLCAILIVSPFFDADSSYPAFNIFGEADMNRNGRSDALDILEGARADAKSMPTYNDQYYEGGYPPDNIGVCADVIWRAFKNAGYDLKKMVDADIRNRPEFYTGINKPDPNIDFRRVVNLIVFFRTCSPALTVDIKETDEWLPGDIAVFANRLGKPDHIGIISDVRAEDGTPFLIHNSGQAEREENALPELSVIAHFRFDVTMLPRDMIFIWE